MHIILSYIYEFVIKAMRFYTLLCILAPLFYEKAIITCRNTSYHKPHLQFFLFLR